MAAEVKTIWATPNGDALIGRLARVSNPANQDNPDTSKLIGYLLRNQHWSPFEMVSMCVEINTTRDIGRQVLRHRSFSFQELCVAGSTKITLELPSAVQRGVRGAYTRTIEHLYSLQQRGLRLPALVRVFDEQSRSFVTAKIKEVFQTGVKPVFRVTLANGRSVDCTKEHKFLTSDGFIPLADAIGLRVIGSTAAFSETGVKFACNGVPAYRDETWLAESKRRCVESGTGLAGIAAEAGVTTHTIRKALKRHSLQFTKSEVASYTTIWNKGLTGYSRQRHSLETIEKIRARARRGVESNLWRGGSDRSERLKIADWCAANRSSLLRAANYKCSRCRSSDRLEMHHIQPVASRPDLAYELANIEVLCKQCHREHHRINGDAKTWRERSRGNTLTIHWSAVDKVEYLGDQMTYDMEVDHSSHNYVANGIVTHNSQRYQDVGVLGDEPVLRECRMQDTKNRQNSLPSVLPELDETWEQWQRDVWYVSSARYKAALANGIAKEQARALLPEGLTPTRMYMAGTLRSWLHYIDLRSDEATQREHREVALLCRNEVREQFPQAHAAMWPELQQ